MKKTYQAAAENKQLSGREQFQALEILAMDAVELEEFLQNEYMSNPMLEYKANHDMHTSTTVQEAPNWYESLYAGRDYVELRDEDPEERGGLKAPATNQIKQYLLMQLDVRRFSKSQWKLIRYLIDSLEDSGFFRMETAQAARLTGRSEEEVEEMLAVLRDLEPFGIFARDLSQCLLKQLEVTGQDTPDLRAMVSDCLPEIGEGKISAISRKLGLSTAQVRKNIAVIGKLNPRPLSGLQEPEVNYIVPDIIYTKKDGKWEITVNDQWFGGYHINNDYLCMMQESQDPELLAYFAEKLERTRFVLTSVRQRRDIMYAVAEKILEKQKDYFERKGKEKPMTLKELAEELELTLSAIGRAVKGKYIQSPAGIILLKKLFLGSVASEEGQDAFSAVFIKERIKELVALEDKRYPYSDARLTELLVEEGIHISRRAVAKYRDELWIKSSFERKERP